MFGATDLQFQGAKPGKLNRPPLKPNVPCETQVAPNLYATQQAPPAKVMTTPNHTKLGDQGLALLEAQVLQVVRQKALGAAPDRGPDSRGEGDRATARCAGDADQGADRPRRQDRRRGARIQGSGR